MARNKHCFLIVILLLLVASVLGGCRATGGESNVVLVNPPANATVVDSDFSDIPRYPVATLVKPQEVPLGAGIGTSKWVRWEVAIYRTDDSVDEVVSFYKQKMPGAGWNGQWKRLGGGMSGSFSKDGVVATISINTGAKATTIVIVRAVHR